MVDYCRQSHSDYDMPPYYSKFLEHIEHIFDLKLKEFAKKIEKAIGEPMLTDEEIE
ncbi:hypothetical protein SNEBB_003823, partial [Seison nebaliae]